MRVPVHKQIWSWGAVAAVVGLALWGLGILAVYGPASRAAAVPPAIATRSA